MHTFVGVHGHWFGGWCWEDVARSLERRGHPTDVVEQLPSVGTDPAALGDLHDDAARLHAHLDRIGGPVTLVGHSYGGMVITEVADHPSVAHSIYVSAFWPQAGQTLLDCIGGGPLPDWVVPREDGSARITEDSTRVRDVMLADLAPRRAHEVHQRLTGMLASVSSLQSPSGAPERAHPTTYVVCERDGAIPPPAQEAMAESADRVVRLDASHCPMLSRPEDLAAIVQEPVPA